MTKTFLSLLLILCSFHLFSQIKVDLDRSVPLWMEYNSSDNEVLLKWITDDGATSYTISEISSSSTLTPLATLDGTVDSFSIGTITKGEKQGFHIRKNVNGRGIITLGMEIPIVHNRGRCLLAIDDILVDSLELEINQMIEDIEMDGWSIDTIHVSQNVSINSVKSQFAGWYESNYDLSQSIILLGHIPVPYSGNTAYDGHGNHQGAWSADAYYGDLDGTWTDISVDNTTPARAVNKNVPDDGKYDQSTLPSDMELEIGRIDFHNLPAFTEDEIELTRKYLNKNHAFKIGNKPYPRRALIENNFGSLTEGFGQSGWRNFTTMFTGDSVTTQNYDTVLETDKYLCSYAAGGGSYTSCSGVGTTQNLWAAKNIQTVFTLNFGSYFGDWDSQNNFMRAALGSGDILTNAWAGRPAWQLYDMALGMHIGHSVRFTQNATGTTFNPGFGAKSSHIALMGDPTLRLHAMKMASDLSSKIDNGNIVLAWKASEDASHGYALYRKKNNASWEFIAEVVNDLEYTDFCFDEFTEYQYMVKAVRLEQTGSGSYYNTSLGVSTSIKTEENTNLDMYYADADMDGFGDLEEIIMDCTLPTGYVTNSEDCDDENAEINPDMEDIANNGIDEDCDGSDLLSSLKELSNTLVNIYPNPTANLINIDIEDKLDFKVSLYSIEGKLITSSKNISKLPLINMASGSYLLEIEDLSNGQKIIEKVILER